MKTVKKSFIAILAAIMLLTIGFTSFMISDTTLKASADDYEIYYFYDYYPSLDHDAMSGANIVYDYHELDSDSFSDLIEEYYFQSCRNADKVIIDIKTFKPSTGDLYDLFHYLHDDLGCKTAFVTPYRSEEFVNTDSPYTIEFILTCIDSYHVTDFSKLEFFVDMALARISYSQLEEGQPETEADRIENTCILLDGRKLIGFYEYDHDIGYLVERNPMLKILANKLRSYAPANGENEAAYLSNLYNSPSNVRIAICTGNDKFAEIGGEEFVASNLQTLHTNLYTSINYTYALGFSELSAPFYNFLLANQNEFDSLPVYVMEVEPIEFSDSGLMIFTDKEARGGDESEESKAVRRIIEDLTHFER